jgi:hypothetical protein
MPAGPYSATWLRRILPVPAALVQECHVHFSVFWGIVNLFSTSAARKISVAWLAGVFPTMFTEPSAPENVHKKGAEMFPAPFRACEMWL